MYSSHPNLTHWLPNPKSISPFVFGSILRWRRACMSIGKKLRSLPVKKNARTEFLRADLWDQDDEISLSQSSRNWSHRSNSTREAHVENVLQFILKLKISQKFQVTIVFVRKISYSIGKHRNSSQPSHPIGNSLNLIVSYWKFYQFHRILLKNLWVSS